MSAESCKVCQHCLASNQSKPYLAQGIEDLVEVDEHLALRDLGDVVHALAGIVADTGVWVAEAGEDGGHDLFQIASHFLYLVS
jgi:hypothetical protein